MRKNSFAFGCIILMSANIITRFMGFFYRIYMSKTIGAQGMGLYQLIMPLYILCYSITASGITTTVSKLTAEETARNSQANAIRILKAALSITLSLSIIISFAMYFNSDTAALYFIKDTRSSESLKILSLCFPFMAAGSCIKGYFLGKQNNIFPALSQIFEQAVRMISLVAIMVLFSPQNIEQSCSAAVVGVVLGEIFFFALTMASLIFSSDSSASGKKPDIPVLSAYRKILTMSVPLSASRVAASFLSAVENILIPLRLGMYPKSTDALSQYGHLSGMVIPLLHFPSSMLSAVSISMIPAISKQRTVKNQHQAQLTVNRSISFTAAASCGAAVFFYAFSSDVCALIYSMPELGTLLRPLSLLCPLMYMQITLNGVLNSLGKHFQLFLTGIASSLVSIVSIYFLMPKIGINAYIYGAFLSSLTAVLPAIIISGKYFSIKRSTLKYYIICGVCAVFSAALSKYIPELNIISRMSVMAFAYIAGLIATGIFSEITGLKILSKKA